MLLAPCGASGALSCRTCPHGSQQPALMLLSRGERQSQRPADRRLVGRLPHRAILPALLPACSWALPFQRFRRARTPAPNVALPMRTSRVWPHTSPAHGGHMFALVLAFFSPRFHGLAPLADRHNGGS